MNIFFSYSLKSKKIGVKHLKKLKQNFLLINTYDIYIDILDNFFISKNLECTKIEINKKNIDSPYQIILKNKLITSDILCVIDTFSSRYSKWVCQEILLAKKYNIPLIRISEDMFFKFLNKDSKQDILNSDLIKTIQLIKKN